jgi:hypothetical protein
MFLIGACIRFALLSYLLCVIISQYCVEPVRVGIRGLTDMFYGGYTFSYLINLWHHLSSTTIHGRRHDLERVS